MSHLYTVTVTDNNTYEILVQAEDEEEARELVATMPSDKREQFRVASLYYIDVDDEDEEEN